MKLSSWQQTPSPLILDQNYINTKNQVIKAERRVLKELGFCVHVKHPHKIIVMYLQVLECERNQTLVQTAWNYMNDSLRTNVFVRFQPETIACACIYLAARALQIPLPTRPHWFLLFGTTEEEIQEICIETLRLYTRKKPNYELLEKEVEKRKVALQEAKLKAKGLNLDGTPALSTLGGFSPASKPSSPREVKAEEKSPVSINVKTVKKEPEDRQQASKSPYNGVRKDSKRSRTSRSASRSRSRTRSRSRSHSPRRHYNNRRSRSGTYSSRSRSRSRSHSESPRRHHNHGSPHLKAKHTREDLKAQIDTVIRGKSLGLDLRARLGITQMLPRNTGTKGDITETGVNDLAPLRGPIKASTMVAVAQDMAGIGADFHPLTLQRFLVLPICSVMMCGLNRNIKKKKTD